MEGGVHIGARALLDIKWIWFGYIARYPSGGGGVYFTRTNNFYLPSLRLEEGVGGQHPVSPSTSPTASVLPPLSRCYINIRFKANCYLLLSNLTKFCPRLKLLCLSSCGSHPRHIWRYFCLLYCICPQAWGRNATSLCSFLKTDVRIKESQ